jgi:predicted ATP-dependent protease
MLRVLSAPQPNAHVLVTGRSGSGRRTAAQYCVSQARAQRSDACDWVYVTSHDGSQLEPHSLPRGQGAAFATEANAAAERARASHQRLMAGDDYRLGLEIIDEEYRQRANKMLDVLKRRAEEQNIALVKTPEGFVLAPMHDGKVVRNDVFRALPEGMQREVENKISGLETDLKAFLELLPEEDNAQSLRVEAFIRDAALRAIRPHTDALRVLFADAGNIIDAVQNALVAAACGQADTRSPAAVAGQVLMAQASADVSAFAPAVFAQDTSPAGLCGEVGFDSTGRLKLKPGALMQANGGYVVVDAWRLAADSHGWAALARALELGHVYPLAPAGVDVGAIALSARIVLIADEHALTRLLSIDSGLRRFFRHIVRLPSTVPRGVMTVAEYAALAASIAEAEGLRSIAVNAADAIYRAALARDGDAELLPLDLHGLHALLLDADLEAAAAGASHIRQSDVEAAARRAAELSIT